MKGRILDLVEKKIDEIQYNSVLAQFVLSKDETWNIVLCRFVFNVEPPQENKTHVKTENFAIEDFSLSLTEFKEFLTYLKDSNTDEVISEINNEPESKVLYKFGSYNLCFVGTCPVAELEFYGRNDTARLHGIPKPAFYTDYYIMRTIAGRIPRDVDLGNLENPFKDAVDAINHYWGTRWEHHNLNNNACRFFMPIYDASIAKASLKNGREFHIKLELNPKTKQEDLSLSLIAKAEGHNYSEKHSIVTNPLIIDIKFTPNDATILLYKHGEKLDEYQYYASIKYDSTGLAGEVSYKTEPKNEEQKILENNSTPKKKNWFRRNIKSELILLAIGIIITLSWPAINDQLFPPQAEIYVGELNAQGGVVDGENPNYEYSPSSITIDGMKTDYFSLTISNTGDGPANNFWIKFDWKPHTEWLNYQNTEVKNIGFSDSCPQKSNECTFEIITKETGPINLQYKATINHKAYQEIKDQNPQIIFIYNHDSLEEKKVILDVKIK